MENFRVSHAQRAGLLDYLEKNYFEERSQARWMLFYRQDIPVAAIDTNNYIESWHNTLKTHFFKNRQKRRLDTVIYTLAKNAIPFYQRKCLLSRLQVGRMGATQRAAMDARLKAQEYIAKQRSLGYYGELVFGTRDREVVKVRSFDDSQVGTFYEIQLDFSRNGNIGDISSCQCKAHQRTRTVCKHIAMVMLEKPPIQFKHLTALWQPHDNHESIEYDEDPIDEKPFATVLSLHSEQDRIIQRLSQLSLTASGIEVLRKALETLEENNLHREDDDYRRRRPRQQKY
jgi:hypothetical protein